MGETKKLPLKNEDGLVKKEAPKKELAKKDQQQPVQTSKLDELKKFLRGVRSELKKVHWPDRPTIITFTGVVLVTVLFVAMLIWVVDTGLGSLLELILKR